MKIEIASKKRNPLLKRMEITLRIEHDQNGGTPARIEVRKALAIKLKTDFELVYVKQIETKTGTMTAIGEANTYESIEQANLIEPKHIIDRNALLKKSEEAEETRILTEQTGEKEES